MKMRIISLVIFLILAFNCFSQKNTAYQYSTFHALAGGCYDGDLKIKDLKAKGNFGLGTFNGLDGELILFNGVCYKAKAIADSTKQIEIVPENEKIPFAEAIFFEKDNAISLTNSNKSNIDSILIQSFSPNSIVAFKLKAKFTHVRYRSVAKQSHPYVVLSKAVEQQKVFEQKNIRGYLVGFYFPSYLKDVNVSGFHWHFISDDKSSGGHVLDYSASDISIEIDHLSSLSLDIPQNKEFLGNNYKAGKQEVELIEQGK